MSSVPIKIFCLIGLDDLQAMTDAPEIDKVSTREAVRALAASLHSGDELVFTDSAAATSLAQSCTDQVGQATVRNVSHDDAIPDLEAADFVMVLAGDQESARFLKDCIEARGIGAVSIKNTGGLAATIPFEPAFKRAFNEDELTYPIFFEKLLERIRVKKQTQTGGKDGK